TGTILDNDQAYLSINDVTILEGQSGTKDLIFTVTLEGDTVNPVTFDYATTAFTAINTTDEKVGSATAGIDYIPVSGSLTLGGAHGAHTAQIVVKVIGDVGKESSTTEALFDEAFNVTLSNETVATVTKRNGVGKILDDADTLPTLSVANASIVEGFL